MLLSIMHRDENRSAALLADIALPGETERPHLWLDAFLNIVNYPKAFAILKLFNQGNIHKTLVRTGRYATETQIPQMQRRRRWLPNFHVITIIFPYIFKFT